MTHAIANQIDRLIGIKAFVMMGTKAKVTDTNSLTFDVKGSKKWNKIRVTLAADDTFTVETYKLGRSAWNLTIGQPIKGVYAANLHDVIANETGLLLGLVANA